MYKKVFSFLLLLSLWLTGSVAFAQQPDSTAAANDVTSQLRTVDSASTQRIQMADRLRTDGKIYVVVVVVVVILLGLILYVARLDRKISRLEKETRRG
jgi:uncharacterized membrane protein YgcG